MERLHGASAKKSETVLQSVTAARSFGPPLKPEPLRVRTRVVSSEKTPRQQRVMLRVRANVHVALQGKEATFNVTTLSVNSGGALVVMERSLPQNTHLILEHAQTRERVACRVTSSGREMRDGFQVPIEFDTPAPGFWKINFPPSD
jgi:hypothetical protein